MFEIKTPYFDEEPWVFFEPKPSENTSDDSSLEGCLRHAAKVEQLIDQSNLYFCEACTKDKYGNSKCSTFTWFLIESKKQHLTQALKRYLLLDPANNLIINLKRF